ncbi:MAG: preprotein translocase subunit YajC [bacterium]
MISTAWAMGSAGGNGTSPTGVSTIFSMLPLIIIFGIFYFLVIKPQQKKQREVQDMIKSIKIGDKIMTSGGIFGIIKGLTEDTISLQIADKVKIDIARTAVARLVEKGQ